MKKVLSFLFFITCCSIASAQTINASLVPEIVKKKMEEKYPEAKGVVWKQSDAGFVEVNFNNQDIKCSALFLASGGWVSTDCETTMEEFPDTAVSFLSDPKNADKVSKYYRSETKAKGLQYSADVKKSGKAMLFIFDDKGNLIMKGPKN
jgi:hypothetical protein